MFNLGYIRLHRKIKENPTIMKDSDYLAVFIYLLLSATHKNLKTDFNGTEIMLKPGQLKTGREHIAQVLKVNSSKVQRILKKLENEQIIEQQQSPKGRLITIINWNKYQMVNNKTTTSEQQVNNKVNTNKNVYNKNINNIYFFLEENFGRTITQVEMRKLDEWKKWFDEDIIKYAIELTLMRGARGLSYTEGIINSWHDKGFKTLEQCKNENRKELKVNQEAVKRIQELDDYDWLND